MNGLDNRINELDNNNAIAAKKYFSNGDMLQNIFDIVRKNFTINDPMGNYNSDIMIVINDDISLNNNVIKIIKQFYDVNKKNMYDIYLTSYAKTENAKINMTLIQKEINILKPRRILYLGIDSNKEGVHNMNKVDFDLFKQSLGDQNKISTPEYEAVKNKFVSLMKYIITGAE